MELDLIEEARHYIKLLPDGEWIIDELYNDYIKWHYDNGSCLLSPRYKVFCGVVRRCLPRKKVISEVVYYKKASLN